MSLKFSGLRNDEIPDGIFPAVGLVVLGRADTFLIAVGAVGSGPLAGVDDGQLPGHFPPAANLAALLLLTDDNLSSLLPFFTEVGRHLKAGQSIFGTDYLYGGQYDYSRDVGYLYWHPFYLGPALLADTPGRFWILDLIAFLFLELTTAGFTVLAWSLREEFSLKLPDSYLIFYTMSYVFSTYILMTGSSWINFLGNQSALPWLVLGILDRKILRGTALVFLFTVHQLVGAYAQLTLSNVLILSVFAAGMAICRRSPRPLFNWCAGTVFAIFVLAPYLIHILDGFAHSFRAGGLTWKERSEYYIPANVYAFSFFLGNWSEPIAYWTGTMSSENLKYPFPSLLLACAAAWCLIPALLGSNRWRPLEILCLVMAGLLTVLIIRPEAITEAMARVPILKSMRWPFRESLEFLFFVHLLLVLRPVERYVHWQPVVAWASLALFVAPLPFIHVFSFNGLSVDRRLLFSGQADAFWAGVKTQLKPTDKIATVLNGAYWDDNWRDIPYTLLGTANFPAFFQVHCISGYSTTAPLDQLAVKTYPYYWFGGFRKEQVAKLLAECPDLKLLRIENTHPLKITMSSGAGPEVDLTPYLEVDTVRESAAAIPQSGH